MKISYLSIFIRYSTVSTNLNMASNIQTSNSQSYKLLYLIMSISVRHYLSGMLKMQSISWLEYKQEMAVDDCNKRVEVSEAAVPHDDDE